MGSRRFGTSANRLLGSTKTGIRRLGSTTNAINQIGLGHPYLDKANTFAQDHVNPAIDFLQAP